MNRYSMVILTALAIVSPIVAQSAQEIFGATKQTQGLCVRIGTTNGSLESDLANNGTFVVYGIASTDADRDAARKQIATRGLQGVVTVETYSYLSRLPMSDNMANLVIADLSSGMSEQEVMRVVSPKGAAYIKKDGAWKSVAKPQPATYGEFSMFEGGAECNGHIDDPDIKVPNSLQWIADYPDRDNGYALNQGSGARIWHDKHIGVEGSVEDREGYLWLKCRNAFNGRLLWRKKTLPKLKGENDYDPRGKSLCLGNNKLFAYIAENQGLATIDLENGNTTGLMCTTRRKNTRPVLPMSPGYGILMNGRSAEPSAQNSTGSISIRPGTVG